MPKVWVVALVALIIGLAVGYGMGRVTLGPSTGTGVKGTYEDGYNAAKAKLLQSGVFPPTMTEVKSLSGQVKSVGDNSFVLTTNLRSPNPLEELTAPADRTVTLASDAKVYRQTPLSPDEFQKEMAAFQKSMSSGEPGTPPTPYKTEEITLKDLKVGDTVTVEADTNILSEASFAATKVTLNGTANAPAGMAPAPIPVGAPLAPAPATAAPTPVVPPTQAPVPTPAP